jgi:hypothetical protein
MSKTKETKYVQFKLDKYIYVIEYSVVEHLYKKYQKNILNIDIPKINWTGMLMFLNENVAWKDIKQYAQLVHTDIPNVDHLWPNAFKSITHMKNLITYFSDGIHKESKEVKNFEIKALNKEAAFLTLAINNDEYEFCVCRTHTEEELNRMKEIENNKQSFGGIEPEDVFS